MGGIDHAFKTDQRRRKLQQATALVRMVHAQKQKRKAKAHGAQSGGGGALSGSGVGAAAAASAGVEEDVELDEYEIDGMTPEQCDRRAEVSGSRVATLAPACHLRTHACVSATAYPIPCPQPIITRPPSPSLLSPLSHPDHEPLRWYKMATT